MQQITQSIHQHQISHEQKAGYIFSKIHMITYINEEANL